MKVFTNRLFISFLITAIFISVTLIPNSGKATANTSHTDELEMLPVQDANGYILFGSPVDGVDCRQATNDDERLLTAPNLSEDLHVISLPRVLGASGLTITLRATGQLEGYPEAKAAFIRAAQTWEGLIASPISIIIDVDFGPTRFGQTYPTGVIGSTLPQSLRVTSGYSDVRAALLNYSSTDAERTLYNLLPTDSLPTNLGTTTYVSAPSALFRALRLINADANPNTETSYGATPSIGFNSNFNFDFDPSNGIDGGKMDFDAVAVHELGHVLGFISYANNQSGGIVNPTLWDFFRFNPGVTTATFATSQRVLTSGGTQVCFTGSAELNLSNATDGNQTSHWKDDQLTGQHIGIMDPTMPTGRRFTVLQNDLTAIDLMGYSLKASSGGGGGGGGTGGGGTGNTPPSTSQFSVALIGETLTLTGTAIDPDADVRQAQITLLDKNSAAIGLPLVADVSFGTSTQSAFDLRVTNMGSYATAMQAKLVFVDARGNQSTAVTGDFSRAETGGATINKGIFDGTALVLKGSGYVTGGTELEINGVLVSVAKIKIKGGGVKAVFTGSSSTLNLRNGANRVRTRTNGKFSNILLLNL
ncbi:MAG: NF038122 family metalloprotease [Acidobacteriota bacterium]